MKVNGKNLTTIWYDKHEDLIKIIDQTLLPHQLKIVNLTTLSDSIYAIKEMQVRGAPLIGVTAAYGMYLASKENSDIDYLIKSGKQLKETRPTAVNLSWAVDLIIDKLIDIDDMARSKYLLNLIKITKRIKTSSLKLRKVRGDFLKL